MVGPTVEIATELKLACSTIHIQHSSGFVKIININVDHE